MHNTIDTSFNLDHLVFLPIPNNPPLEDKQANIDSRIEESLKRKREETEIEKKTSQTSIKTRRIEQTKASCFGPLPEGTLLPELDCFNQFVDYLIANAGKAARNELMKLKDEVHRSLISKMSKQKLIPGEFWVSFQNDLLTILLERGITGTLGLDSISTPAGYENFLNILRLFEISHLLKRYTRCLVIKENVRKDINLFSNFSDIIALYCLGMQLSKTIKDGNYSQLHRRTNQEFLERDIGLKENQMHTSVTFLLQQFKKGITQGEAADFVVSRITSRNDWDPDGMFFDLDIQLDIYRAFIHFDQFELAEEVLNWIHLPEASSHFPKDIQESHNYYTKLMSSFHSLAVKNKGETVIKNICSLMKVDKIFGMKMLDALEERLISEGSFGKAIALINQRVQYLNNQMSEQD